MKKEKIKKILIIISIIIIIFGILSAITVVNEIKGDSEITNNSGYMIDGSDFTIFVKGFVGIGTAIVGFMVVFYFIVVVIIIWIIYGIILLIIKIINKTKERKVNGERCDKS